MAGLFKTEVARQHRPWCSLEEVALPVPEWARWFNHHHLLEPPGYLPPAEYEEGYYRRQESEPLVVALT